MCDRSDKDGDDDGEDDDEVEENDDDNDDGDNPDKVPLSDLMGGNQRSACRCHLQSYPV